MDNPRTSSLSSRPDLLDPATLSQLGGIEFIARGVVEGFLMGLHRSPHRGFSAEFAELRAYQAGDDLRYIDWRMYGRSDRFYVKQFEQETNLRAHLLLDVSESMRFGTGPLNKFEYSATAAAAITFLLLKQRDAVGMRLFDDALQAAVPLSSNWHSLHNMLALVDPVKPRRKTDFSVPLRDFADLAGRRSMIVTVRPWSGLWSMSGRPRSDRRTLVKRRW